MILENSPTANLVGRLEHQMLEEMGDARDALGLVGGADLVPDHVGDDRRAVIGDHHDLQAVGELELTRAGPSLHGEMASMRVSVHVKRQQNARSSSDHMILGGESSRAARIVIMRRRRRSQATGTCAGLVDSGRCCQMTSRSMRMRSGGRLSAASHLKNEKKSGSGAPEGEELLVLARRRLSRTP